MKLLRHLYSIYNYKYIKRKPLSKKIREIVYAKYDGHCAYCGCELEMRQMQVDHIKSVYVSTAQNGWNATQDDSIENLMPSCRQCNFYKGVGNIEYLRRMLKDTLYHTCVDNFQAKLAMKYGILTLKPWDGLFFFQ